MDRIRISCVLVVLPALLQCGCWNRPDEVASEPSAAPPIGEDVREAAKPAPSRYPQQSLETANLTAPVLPSLESATADRSRPKKNSIKKIHLNVGQRSLPVFRLPSLENSKVGNSEKRQALQIEVGDPIVDIARLPGIHHEGNADVSVGHDKVAELTQPIGDVVAHEIRPLPAVDEPTASAMKDDGRSVWSQVDQSLERDWPAVAAAPSVVSNPPPHEEVKRLPALPMELPLEEETAPVESVTTLEAIQLPEQPSPTPSVQPMPTVSEKIVVPAKPQAEARPLVDPMRAVNAQAIREIQHAFSLAQRGAMYSARVELTEALRTITEALDLRDGSREHTDALKSGFRALDEAKDFRQRGLAEELDMEVLVAAHRTPVLKETDVTQITPLVALQKYLTYAQQQLAIAGGDQPTASLALYGLGRLQADLHSQQDDALPQALVFHQAAVMVDEMNYKAANELGVLLATYGQYEQARNMLAHSVRVCPQPESWHNLAKIHEQLGEADLARRAANESRLAAQGNRSHGGVRWVDPATLTGTIETNQPVRRVTQPSEPETQSPTRNASQEESDGLMRLLPWMRRGE